MTVRAATGTVDVARSGRDLQTNLSILVSHFSQLHGRVTALLIAYIPALTVALN